MAVQLQQKQEAPKTSALQNSLVLSFYFLIQYSRIMLIIQFLRRLFLVRNILRIGISAIAYLRHLFPEDCFADQSLAGMNLKLLMSTTEESRLLVSWLEDGVFQALEMKYVCISPFIHSSFFLLVT